MAIATFRQSSSISSLLAKGRPDVDKAVDTTMRFFDAIDADGDERKLRSAYKCLAGLGYNGRLYPKVPSALSTRRLMEVADSLRPQNVAPIEEFVEFWTDGKEAESVTDEEFNGSVTEFAAALAVFSATPGSYDPLLHFRNLPFDGKYPVTGTPTQCDEVKRVQREFATKHPSATMEAADQRDFLIWLTMDRLDGVDPRNLEFVLNSGWMRIPRLGRRRVGVSSCVGAVCSGDGRGVLGWAGGYADGGGGVGLSLEIQV